MSLSHCIYSSVQAHAMDHAQLAALLANARLVNAHLGVTGMLLHVDDTFFQVLEGEDAVVRALFEKIGTDPRHLGVTRIIHESLHSRRFANWTMGFASLSSQELASLVGVNDFFTEASCLTALGEGRAKKILEAFSRGRWRNRAA